MTEENEKNITPTETPEVKPTKVSSKSRKKTVPAGEMHIKATFNNTIITITDKQGGALAISSAGANGFRGSKKGTAYAAQVAAEKAIEKAKNNFGMSSVDVFVKGIGLGRDSAIRALLPFGITINSIKDLTALPHGGVRPKGERKP
ncbi:MAG: 30S ribosomal protein S11 [Candidatus Nomurabacteria bacterium]|nr:30S ribosomal protein S11 [Candidatus Nomurabacteria bacterium]